MRPERTHNTDEFTSKVMDKWSVGAMWNWTSADSKANGQSDGDALQ
jgi:hypothetical protein